jgi:hypothetical protein
VKLLADTSALLALAIRRDPNHDRAVRFAREAEAARFVISELILAELATRLRAVAGSAPAVARGRELLRSERYQLIFADGELVAGGLARMEQFADKQLSLTDCVSFELIDRLGLDGAFSFDRDFRDCGYRMVP